MTRVTIGAVAVLLLLVASDPNRFWVAGMTTGLCLLLLGAILGALKVKVAGPIMTFGLAACLISMLGVSYDSQIRTAAIVLAIGAAVWGAVWLIRRHRRNNPRPQPET
jgi:zinc transporter ZupT